MFGYKKLPLALNVCAQTRVQCTPILHPVFLGQALDPLQSMFFLS